MSGCGETHVTSDAGEELDAPLGVEDSGAGDDVGADAPPIPTDAPPAIDRVIVAASAPGNAPDLFGGPATTTGAPELVYPVDGTVLPPNLAEVELHFIPAAWEVFEITFEAPGVRVRVYLGCAESVGAGCAWIATPTERDEILGALRGVGVVTYRIRGTSSTGGPVGGGADRQLRLADEDVIGTIYYWNTAGSIDRLDFGDPLASPAAFLRAPDVGASTCVGCHALSRDGSRIAIGTDIPNTTVQVLDVASRTRIFALAAPSPRPAYFAFGPGSPPLELVTSGFGGLQIRDATDGSLRELLATAPSASMPDWSRDGDRIVYVSYPRPAVVTMDTPFITSGTIETFARTAGAWSPGLGLATGGNNFYPSFSPDGAWISFVHSESNRANGGDATEAHDEELSVVAWSGEPPIRLARARGLGDSWPRWNPTAYTDDGRPLFWLTWSSLRGFGLRTTDGTLVQLWMAAFDPAEAIAGRDPLAAPFRIPRQGASSGNHTAQWTE